jgi:hypothetical protein
MRVTDIEKLTVRWLDDLMDFIFWNGPLQRGPGVIGDSCTCFCQACKTLHEHEIGYGNEKIEMVEMKVDMI